VLHPPREVSDTDRLTRELLRLVVVVLLIEAGFIALDLLTPLRSASAIVKLGYTALWTGVTLVAVLRGLARMRAIRRRGPGRPG
jgi:hypothetical protein